MTYLQDDLEWYDGILRAHLDGLSSTEMDKVNGDGVRENQTDVKETAIMNLF